MSESPDGIELAYRLEDVFDPTLMAILNGIMADTDFDLKPYPEYPAPPRNWDWLVYLHAISYYLL